ncbi:MAG: DUF945 domain-containing protein [Proteobacteria bacterium]|nr:DUF945 domain-containing protein [Pseudomonadota bacterium]
MNRVHPVSFISSPFPRIGEEPVTWGKERGCRLAENYKAVVDLNTGKLFSIVSKDYRLIRHEQAIEQVEEAIFKTASIGTYEAYTEFYNEGGRMRRTYRFPETAVEINKGDLVDLELYLFNSYDRTWPLIILLGAFRLVCTNGLVVGQKYLHLRKRHVYELGQINVSEEVLTALKRFRSQTKQWKRWAGKRLTRKGCSRVLESMKPGIKATEEIQKKVNDEAEGFEPDGFAVLTVWGFYNILTWYISHYAVSLNHQVEMEGRLRRAIFHLMR